MEAQTVLPIRLRFSVPLAFQILVAWSLWALLAAGVRAQPAVFHGPGRYPDTVFETLNQKDGLADAYIQAIAQDGNGFLWVGSQSGMSRWDGYRFRNYSHEVGNPHSLPVNIVMGLYTDPAGCLWVATISGGVARYNAASDDFTTFLPAGSGPAYKVVTSMVTDGAHGLWVGTSGGLDHLDAVSGTMVHAKADGLTPGRRVEALLRDATGRIWAGTSYGLFVSDPGATRFASVTLPPGISPHITSLLRGSGGNLWVGSATGVALLQGQEMTPRVLEETTAVADQRIDAMTEVAPGVVWLGTRGYGILCVDTRTHESYRILHDPAFPTSLAEDMVRALYRDPSGVVWVGTELGLSHSNQGQLGILTYYGGQSGIRPASGRVQPSPMQTSAVQADRIANSNVLAVLPGGDGALWLGLETLGVQKFDGNGTAVSLLLPKSKEWNEPPTENYNALSSLPGTDAVLAGGPGLYRLDAKGQSAVPVPFGADLQNRIASQQSHIVQRLLVDRDTLWIGTEDSLWRKSLSPTSQHEPDVHIPLPAAEIIGLARDSGNNLWIASIAGLFRWDIASQTVESISSDPANPHGLPAMPSTLLVDRKGRLWVGTLGAGLYLLQGRDTHGLPNFQRLAGDLPNQTVDKLLEAPDGTIWASTDNGLATVDPVSFAIHPIRQAGGIGILNYWNSSGAISPAGLVMFGGQGGLTVIDPALAKPSAYVAPVAVTDVTIGGKAAPPSAFSRFYPEAVLEVSPGENSFAVEFAALDYADPMQNLYSYRLAGYDHDWIETPATRRLASYTNLPPGHYRLELRGSNRNGVWGEPLSIRVYVRPAWFQTVWAKIGAAFLFLLSLFALFQLGRRVAAARQRELEQQVSLRTEELRQSQLQLEEMAYYDSLTGLANRRMFAERFRRLLAMKRRQPGGFCLLTFDMDYFKAINDECGHGAGDALLKEVAIRLAPVVRELDCFARMGGDEFAMLLDQPYNEKHVEIVCLRIAASLSEPLMHEGLSLTATFSIGVAAFPQDGEDEDTLFKSADIALYQVKRGGRNGWRKYRGE